MWDLLGKTKRAVERNTLPTIRIAWAMMSYSSVGKRLIADLEDWDSTEMEAISKVDLILVTIAVDLLQQ